MKKVGIRLAIVFLALAVPLAAWAGCRSDYQDEVEMCRMLHEGPGEAEDLQACIEAAKDDYDSCVD